MSTDERVTKSLITTLEDGQRGFASAADRLTDSNQPGLAAEFMRFSEQRARFASELRTMAASYGDDVDPGGSMAAVVHRGWMAVKDALSGSDASGVLDAAEQGEDHAVAEYRQALTEDLSGGLRSVVERQYTEVQEAHRLVRSLRDQAA